MKPKESVVATFSDIEKAQEVQKRLVAAGIPAAIHNESTLQKFWFLSKPLAADKVVVNEKDFEKSMQVLESTESAGQDLLHGEIRCPQCGSAEIEYPQFTRKYMTTTAVEVLCFLHLLDKEFYCMQCHNTWPVSIHLRKKIDILNWPLKHNGVVKKEEG